MTGNNAEKLAVGVITEETRNIFDNFMEDGM